MWQSWLLYAILSAVFAALVAIFGKIGLEKVDSTLATTVRSIVMAVFLIGTTSVLRLWPGVDQLSKKAMSMIALSGLAGALSWLFYFKAVQVGKVTQVAPIDKLSVPLAAILAVLFLSERPTLVNWVGIVLVAVGATLSALPAK